VIENDSRRGMMWLLLCLTISGALTGAAVIVSSIKRLADAAYRLGHAAGARTTCGCHRPALTAVNGGAQVLPFRSMHTDN
jgi:hypothetical protein